MDLQKLLSTPEIKKAVDDDVFYQRDDFGGFQNVPKEVKDIQVDTELPIQNIIDDLTSLAKVTEEEAQDFIAIFKEEFKSLPPEDVAFPRGVNGLREYSDRMDIYKKGTPIHVRGALLYNNCLKQKDLIDIYPTIKEGEKLKFTYLLEPNPLKDDVVSFPNRLPKEFDLHKYVDYNMQFEKGFIDPMKVILNCMGWNTEKRNSLESFF
jgi:hypothetical protein